MRSRRLPHSRVDKIPLVCVEQGLAKQAEVLLCGRLSLRFYVTFTLRQGDSGVIVTIHSPSLPDALPTGLFGTQRALGRLGTIAWTRASQTGVSR